MRVSSDGRFGNARWGRRVLVFFALMVALIAAPTSRAAHGQVPPSAPGLGGFDACREAVARRVPGVALATFVGDRVTFDACGMRDVRGRRPVTPATVFEAASLSKPVFAYAVWHLARTGALDLDAPLGHYLGGAYTHQQDPFQGAGRTDRVTDPRILGLTARMVLTPTTGLPNWADTAPLGMTRTRFRWAPRFAGDAAVGYPDSGGPVPPGRYRRPLASTTLYTTVRDYARFVRHLMRDPAALAALCTPRVAVDTARGVWWGLGLGVEQGGDPAGDPTNAGAERAPACFHGGSTPGYRAYVFVAPRARRGVLFFSNADGGYALVAPLVEHTVPGPHPALRSPALHLPSPDTASPLVPEHE